MAGTLSKRPSPPREAPVAAEPEATTPGPEVGQDAPGAFAPGGQATATVADESRGPATRPGLGLGGIAETAEHEVQVVTFKLGKEEYAIEILRVQEIVMITEITRMPKAARFIEGIVNLRGQMIPIIDMRKRFELPQAEHDAETRIIIVDIGSEIVGMVVDGVKEVIRLPDSAISPPPPMIQGISSEYLKGIGQIGERLLIMLDLAKVLTADEHDVLRKLGPDGCPLQTE